jgi:hypothetical protein
MNSMVRASLICLNAFLAVTAIYGAVFVVPSQNVELLVGSPFTDYLVPGLVLGLLVGGTALAAALALLGKPRIGAALSMIAGSAIIGFEIVETIVMGLDVWLHVLHLGPAVDVGKYGSTTGIPTFMSVPLPLWLQPFYILLGALIVALGLRVWTLSATTTSLSVSGATRSSTSSSAVGERVTT